MKNILLISVVFLFSCTSQKEENLLDKTTSTEEIPNTPYVMVLGVAQDAGYPQINCKKECCRTAWENAELQRIPNTTKPIALDQSKKVLRLIEQFEEDDDVQNVFHNLEITDELLQEI